MLVLAAGTAFAQTEDHPYTTAAILAGARLYANNCQLCHGSNGDGIAGVNLPHQQFKHAVSDDDIRATIHGGQAAAGMPPFSALTSGELDALVAFVRSGFDKTGTPIRLGDKDRGRVLYEGKGDCARCHFPRGDGPFGAPSLVDVGDRRVPADIVRTILDPSGTLLPINRSAHIVTSDGRVYNGRRLNEDSYSVQLIDDRHQLVSLLKSDIRQLDLSRVSAMPAYAGIFSDAEMGDLLAYLVSTKGTTSATPVSTPSIPPGPVPDPGSSVSAERIEAAAAEPQNWLTYSGTYDGQRFSRLGQITTANVNRLQQKWMLQTREIGYWESNPLVVNGVMYVTQRPDDVVALDARTGKVFWIYHYAISPDTHVCCGANNRGLAMLGDTLYLATLDAHLVALDARTGQVLWNVTVADTRDGYAMTGAPLTVHDKIVVGVSGGEYGIRGFIAAYDAATGEQAWRFETIPGPGSPGHDTWSGDDWEHGGGPTWVTGSFDPALNLIYWGVGNPGPDWNPSQRPGDNLYTDSVVALDAATGKLRWHFQFTPNDGYDYDSVQVPVLVNMDWKGKPSKLMLWANRNGFFYVLDRVTGKFLLGEPMIKLNWASGLDANGRPRQTRQPAGAPTFPGVNGGTNWYPPAFNPGTGLFYVPIWENYGAVYRPQEEPYRPGNHFTGGAFSVLGPTPNAPTPLMGKVGPPVDTATDETGYGAVIAIDPHTGKRQWTYRMFDVTDAGMLTTASGLVFSGGREGYFYALDARSGRLLWKSNLGGMIAMAPISFEVDRKQYVAVISGSTLVTFALDD
jgi:alcohol dehydrogenase (cytochrome c)